MEDGWVSSALRWLRNQPLPTGGTKNLKGCEKVWTSLSTGQGVSSPNRPEDNFCAGHRIDPRTHDIHRLHRDNVQWLWPRKVPDSGPVPGRIYDKERGWRIDTQLKLLCMYIEQPDLQRVAPLIQVTEPFVGPTNSLLEQEWKGGDAVNVAFACMKERKERMAAKHTTSKKLEEITSAIQEVSEAEEDGCQEEEMSEQQAAEHVSARKKRKTSHKGESASNVAAHKQYGLYLIKYVPNPRSRGERRAIAAGAPPDHLFDVDVGKTGKEFERMGQHQTHRYDKLLTPIHWVVCDSAQHVHAAEQTFHFKWRRTRYHMGPEKGVQTATELYEMDDDVLKQAIKSLEKCVEITRVDSIGLEADKGSSSSGPSNEGRDSDYGSY